MLEVARLVFTCAPTAARARAARESFMVLVLVGILRGMFLSDSGDKKRFGLTERMKD